jgi:queuine tRNA-ribosyltransferase
MKRVETPAELVLPHGTLSLPTFLPDATVGVVRAVDSSDLQTCGVRGLVMNTFHLM